MKKVVLSSILVLLFAVFGCHEQDSVLESDFGTETQISSLAKKVWYSTSQSWSSTSTTFGQNCFTWNKAYDNLSFSFRGYNFSFSRKEFLMRPENFAIEVRVNGTLVATLTNSIRFANFTYDGKNMKVNVLITQSTVTDKCNNDRQLVLVEPNTAEAEVEEATIDAPTGFDVSPYLHNNYSQTVSITWDASTDTDVTGYKVYRGRYSYYNNQLVWHNYSLVHTINSRTTSSWSDSPLWGIDQRGGVGYLYKVTAVSSTLGMESGYSADLGESYLDDYDHLIMP